MTVEAESAANEWRSGWSLVLGAAIGVTLLNVGFMSAGTFVAPLEQAFGWSRAEISSGTTVVALTGVFFGPLVGMVVDRWGARRVVLPGAVLYGLVLAAPSTDR
jgi:MFS family permease